MKLNFRRLEYLYLTALGCIALAIIVSQILIQTSINRQQDDARVINVAGRQRMLSQQISKLSLKIQNGYGDNARNIDDLNSALSLWKNSHEGLQVGDSIQGLSGINSAKIKSMFAEIEPHFNAIYSNADSILNSENSKEINNHIDVILTHEADFLEGMDRIVFQYDAEASEKVAQLKRTEIYLFFASILIIGLELIFVFRPLAKNVRKTVSSLQQSEDRSKKVNRELSKLYEELGKSYQDLEAVNIKPESPSVYATISKNGKFLYHSPKFLQLMEYSETAPPKTLQELLKASDYDEKFIKGLMDHLKAGKNWNGEIRLISEPGDFVWLESFIVLIQSSSEIKLVARDVTEFKEAKVRSREINHERIEKIVKEQQYRSSFILEGQEEERKRLSRELHDGLGQMLSAMKLQLESIVPSSKPTQLRLEDTKDLMKSIIREVRRVSFNLTPSSLDDFGLVPAVSKFCEEINKVTKINLEFVNETRFINRLESKVETNLYRITQEAVNNAIKYSKASNILVRFSHDINSLNIMIEDDGKGFNYNEIQQTGHFERPGHGIFNMKERTSYIGGSFSLQSSPGDGTKILITLSLDKND